MDKAKKAGLSVKEIAEGVKGADFVMMLMPDEHIAAVYTSEVEPNIRRAATLDSPMASTFHYGQVMPREDLDVVNDRAQAPGHTVRSTYAQGGGTPMLIAVPPRPERKSA